MTEADIARISRARIAADIRTSKRRIAEARKSLDSGMLPPGAKQVLREEIEFEARNIQRRREDARASRNPVDETVSLRDQFEADGTFDRLLDQFRDNKRRDDKLDRIAAALDATPQGGKPN